MNLFRVALSFPNIFFSLTSNGPAGFHLEAGTLKQRVLQLLGNQYAAKLVNIKEENRLYEHLWFCRQTRYCPQDKRPNSISL